MDIKHFNSLLCGMLISTLWVRLIFGLSGMLIWHADLVWTEFSIPKGTEIAVQNVYPGVQKQEFRSRKVNPMYDALNLLNNALNPSNFFSKTRLFHDGCESAATSV